MVLTQTTTWKWRGGVGLPPTGVPQASNPPIHATSSLHPYAIALDITRIIHYDAVQDCGPLTYRQR